MSATYHGQLRLLAEQEKQDFSVTTKGHIWIVKFGAFRTHGLDLQDALKDMVDLVGVTDK